MRSTRATLLTAALLIAALTGACHHRIDAAQLVRVTGEATPAELAALYKARGLPLVLVFNEVYVPPCACLSREPCPGGERIYGGAVESRQVGGAKDDREHGGAKDDREHGGAQDDREHGGAKDDRQHGGAQDDREHGGANDSREGGGNTEAREHGGGNDSREGGGGTEVRERGGAQAQISCRQEDDTTFKVVAPDPTHIRYFDGRSVLEATDGLIPY